MTTKAVLELKSYTLYTLHLETIFIYYLFSDDMKYKI